MQRSATGVGYLIEGLRLIRQPRLRRFVIVPLAVNVVLFAGGLYALGVLFGEVMDWLMAKLPAWLEWLQFLLWPLFALSALLVVFFTFTLVANLIAAPFNGLLAEAVERHITGRAMDDAGGWKALLADIVPSLLSELRKLLYFVVWAIPFALLFLVPVINVVAPLAWALFSAWMLALEYCDFPMDNHGLKFPAQRVRARRRRFRVLGFGLGVLVLTSIPLVNFIAMPAAVAGATAMWVREDGFGEPESRAS